jgi:hypothetical protein
MAPARVVELTPSTDHFQFYVADVNARWWEDDSWIDDPLDVWPGVGITEGFVSVGTASYAGGPVRIEVWEEEPPLDEAGWEHLVDLPLAVGSGRVSVGYDLSETVELAAGDHRVRIAGRDLDSWSDLHRGGDSYRLQLWPAAPAPPSLLKVWKTLREVS